MLNVNDRLGVDFRLTVGQATEQITVSASDIPLLQTEDSSTGLVASQSVINDTPLNQRNYVFIAQLAAGVAQTPPSYGRSQVNGDFDANGVGPYQNDFILDGVDNNTSAIDFLNNASYVIKPPPDALAEFKVQTSDYSAELGHGGGAVVNASIKSGTMLSLRARRSTAKINSARQSAGRSSKITCSSLGTSRRIASSSETR